MCMYLEAGAHQGRMGALKTPLGPMGPLEPYGPTGPYGASWALWALRALLCVPFVCFDFASMETVARHFGPMDLADVIDLNGQNV